jgi:hypothetical protein
MDGAPSEGSSTTTILAQLFIEPDAGASAVHTITLAQYRRFLAVLARRRETQAIDFAHVGRGAVIAIGK